MNYFDSSALLKLLFDEDESEALEDWVDEQAAVTAVTSELAKIEVLRATRRLDPHQLAAAHRLLTQVDLMPITSDVVESATAIAPDPLRTLDAIHLASAAALGPALAAMVAYDARLVAAARSLELPVAQPGVRRRQRRTEDEQ